MLFSKFYRCLDRKTQGKTTINEDLSSIPFMKPVNLPLVLYGPIINSMCDYKDIYTLTLEDFITMNELIEVKRENEKLLNDYYSKKYNNKRKI